MVDCDVVWFVIRLRVLLCVRGCVRLGVFCVCVFCLKLIVRCCMLRLFVGCCLFVCAVHVDVFVCCVWFIA